MAIYITCKFVCCYDRCTLQLNFFIVHFRYVITDVLLLVDVLERYRHFCWDRLQLEALSYVSLPSLTYDACLKLTKTRLQVVKCINMLEMIQLGIRGGISVISHRHAVANNPFTSYDPTKPESYLMYLDANVSKHSHPFRSFLSSLTISEPLWVCYESESSNG